MRFFYKATKSDGTIISDSIEASSINEATKELLTRGLYVKKISKSRTRGVNLPPIFLGKVTLMDKLLFTKHLSTMIKSGITISKL